MIDFINAVREFPFLQHAIIAGILACIACGIVGTYVVTKRITFISGGIAHTVLGGMGLSAFINAHFNTSIHPLFGAILAALFAATVIGWITLHARHDVDTVIGALWAFGMAAGLIFIAKTPGYNKDLMTYLFGNILIVEVGDLYLLIGLDLLIVFFAVILYNRFLSLCFDEDFTRIKGINSTFYYIFLLNLTALTVVALMQIVGLILVIALLTIPATIARQFVTSMWKVMLFAIILGVFFTVFGLYMSFEPDLPSGAVIIVVTSVAFVFSILLKWSMGKVQALLF